MYIATDVCYIFRLLPCSRISSVQRDGEPVSRIGEHDADAFIVLGISIQMPHLLLQIARLGVSTGNAVALRC